MKHIASQEGRRILCQATVDEMVMVMAMAMVFGRPSCFAQYSAVECLSLLASRSPCSCMNFHECSASDRRNLGQILVPTCKAVLCNADNSFTDTLPEIEIAFTWVLGCFHGNFVCWSLGKMLYLI